MRRAWQQSLIWSAAICICLGAGYFGYALSWQQQSQDADNQLELQAVATTAALAKHRLLAPLVARQDEVIRALRFHDFSAQTRTVKTLAANSGAYEVLLIDELAAYIAQGTQRIDTSTLPLSALIQQTQQGRLGRANYRYGSTQLYAHAAAVRHFGNYLGTLILFYDLEIIQNPWALIKSPVVAHNGLEVLASNDLRYRFQAVKALDFDDPRWRQRSIPLLDWTLAIEINRLNALIHALQFSTIAALLCASLAVVMQSYRRRVKARERYTRALDISARRLEHKVKFRTKDLAASNAALEAEIGERKRAQDEVIHAAKMAAIGQLATTISHEYNQPLAAMSTRITNAQLLLQKQKYTDLESTLQALDEQVSRMTSLSKSLLSFARKPGSGLSMVSLGDALNEALALTLPLAKRHRITIGTPSTAIHVYGGTIRLTQILVNLFKNSIDAMSASHGDQIEVRLHSTAQHIALEVHDNGPGFDEQALSTALEPFFTTKPKGIGLGLGLSIVRDMVDGFGGTIVLDHSDMGGACVRIKLLKQPPLEAE
ncbi:MAG: hypothetical protein HWE20_01935 [Gammaproteobacteria bacterium]|nr:hypothetical protein [Gammaproteobacteria bacterium]